MSEDTAEELTPARVAELIDLYEEQLHYLDGSLFNTSVRARQDTVTALKIVRQMLVGYVHLSNVRSKKPDSKVYSKRDVEALIAVAEALRVAHQAKQPPDDGRSVAIPKNAEQADCMLRLGYSWLATHAPDRLRKPPDLSTLTRYTPQVTVNGLGTEVSMFPSDVGAFVLFAAVEKMVSP